MQEEDQTGEPPEVAPARRSPAAGVAAAGAAKLQVATPATSISCSLNGGHTMSYQRLGDRLREKRLEKKLGLREAALKLGISPTYLSRIETHQEANPPTEEVLRTMAKLLGDDFDTLMSLAGRVESDITAYISSDPGFPQVLRTAKDQNMSAADLGRALRKKK